MIQCCINTSIILKFNVFLYNSWYFSYKLEKNLSISLENYLNINATVNICESNKQKPVSSLSMK